MPQLQVLQRDADPRENQMVKSLQSANEAMNQRKQVEGYLLQLKLMSKNADNEQEKMKWQRKADITKTLLEAKDKGLSEQAIMALTKVFGEDDTWESVTDLSKQIASSPESAEAVAKRGEGAMSQAIASRIAGQRRPPPTAQVGVGSEGIPDANPRVGVMQGQESQAPSDVLVPETTYKGTRVVFPEDMQKEEDIKVRARNAAERETRNLTEGEQTAKTYVDVISESVPALKDFYKTKGTTGLKNWTRDLRIGSKQPAFVRGEDSLAQGHVQALSNVVKYLLSGKAVTGPEAEELYRMINPANKEEARIQQDLDMFTKIADERLKSMLGGATSIRAVGTGQGRANALPSKFVAQTVSKSGRPMGKLPDGRWVYINAGGE
jgi:hypothetical protein